MYLPLKILKDDLMRFKIEFPKNNYNNILYLDLIKKYSNLKWVGGVMSDDLSIDD